MRKIVWCFLLVWLCTSGMDAQTKPDDSQLVITNVNVVDVAAGTVRPDMDGGDRKGPHLLEWEAEQYLPSLHPGLWTVTASISFPACGTCMCT